MWVRILLIFSAAAFLCGCFEISPGKAEKVQCSTTGFTSHLIFLVNSPQGLPNVLSGQVNDDVAFDECNGNDTFLYTIVRTDSHHAQVHIWLPPSAKGYDKYFDENNQPLPSPKVSYKIFGRPYCDDDQIIMRQGTDETIGWHPLFTENSGCPDAGYSAVVE